MNIRLLTLLLLACWCRAAAPIIQTPARGIVVSSSPPAFRQIGALAADASAGGYSITPALPTGWQANDIHLLMVASSASATFSGLGAWNSLGSSDQTTLYVQWYWRRAQGGDTAPTIGISAGGNSAIWGQIVGYSGCVTSGDPYDDTTIDGSTSDTTPDTALVTSAGDNRRAVCMMATSDDLAWTTGSPPSGWTERGDEGNNIGDDAWFTFIEQTADVDNGQNAAATQIGTLAASQAWASLTILLDPP